MPGGMAVECLKLPPILVPGAWEIAWWRSWARFVPACWRDAKGESGIVRCTRDSERQSGYAGLEAMGQKRLFAALRTREYLG